MGHRRNKSGHDDLRADGPAHPERRLGGRQPLPFPWDSSSHPEPRSLSRPLTETHTDAHVLWQSQKLESLGLMAGGVAHDFNNCLLAIMGNADLLDQGLAADATDRQLVTEIRTAAERAGDLCNQLLAFAGKGRFRLEPLNLSVVVRGMVRMLKVAVSGKITLRLELADELPLIEADRSQIHQVVMNLAVNASESLADRPGTITLRTGVRSSVDCSFDQCVMAPRSSAGTFVYLEVTDTGPGMDPITVSRAFDPFYSTKPQGRGLGLASVLGIARSHWGTVGVDSVQGRGSTITVLIPHSEVPALPNDSPQTTAVSAGGGTILVVDDEQYLRVLSERMLDHLGYQVYVADGGAAALAMCRRLGAELDCVMLDLVMPEMDGSEVYGEIRKIYPELKVLLTSGYHEAEVSRRFAGRGLAGFLQKPYVLEDLARKLDEILNPD